jgi:hypothetical protein
LKEPADLACRKLAVSFRGLSNDWFVPRVSRGRKDNYTSHAERACYQENRPDLYQEPTQIDSRGRCASVGGAASSDFRLSNL